MTKEKTFTVTMDNQKVEARAGLTILEAARQHGVYIPSLCAFEHLPSYGACRMCLVEVDGLRGFPTACTTPIEEGMVIRTDSAEIRGLRQEILKLLLSEHPGSCLFCGEKEECVKFQGTIRKAGMTTGCRYCPNDGRCELQQITEKVGLTDTSYPVYFRNFTVEKSDPFYDRDYNLCVLCGRCVRVCNNVRLNGTLSFKQRGKQTTIGPAFDRSHLEGGCEFCGSCVGACPTGALSAKTSKWDGKPEKEIGSTCPYCSLGCRLMLQVKKGRVIDALPDYQSAVDHGLVCVKGRFGVPEYVNAASRLSTPRELTPMGYEQVSWDRALGVAAQKLSTTGADDFLMLLSPHLSNEDLFAAQQFSRQVMGGEHLTSGIVAELGEAFAPFLGLATRSDPIEAIDEAQVIFTVGFDSRYGYSPAGVAIKRAVERGARLFSLTDLETNLDMITDGPFKLESSRWTDFLHLFLLLQEKGEKKAKVKGDKRFSDLFSFWRDEIERLEAALSSSRNNVAIVGPEVVRAPERADILGALEKVNGEPTWKMIFMHPYGNLTGMAVMGALPGVKPGEAVRKSGQKKSAGAVAQVKPVDLQKHWKVIYVIGEACQEWLPEHDYLIYQNAFPAYASCQPDLVLPSALFTESRGTMINYEGRIVAMEKAAEPAGSSKPDWWILGKLSEQMGSSRMQYTDVSAVQSEIRKHLKTFLDIKKRLMFTPFEQVKGAAKKPVQADGEMGQAAGSFLLYHKPEQESYRGVRLSDVVSGMRMLGNRGYLLVNTDDARKLGLEEDGTVDVGWNGLYLQFPVRTSGTVNSGILHLLAMEQVPFPTNPCAVQLRRNNE